jgi:putative oxygen-independent coproporphyrinogen III oxidase
VGILGKEKIEETIGVYAHIPFCVHKCRYCDFKSVAPGKKLPETRYAECVERELSSVAEKEGLSGAPRNLESLYIGGGTPSLFSPSSIERIIKTILSFFPPLENTEITLEANPDTIDAARLRGYRKAGVNRLSLGFQSLIDTELKTLGRTHSAGKALRSFEAARLCGFWNVGVDLIYGVPGQSLESWVESLQKVVSLRPEHISLYNLTLEEGTPFHRSYVDERDESRPTLPAEDEEVRMYGAAVDMLERAGYAHYEISNWSLEGFESAHNRRYWTGGDYLGLGSSAHSFLRGVGWGTRWWNEPDPYRYMTLIEEKGEAAAGSETLTREEAMTESLMLGLRMLDRGIDATAFKGLFGVYPKEAFGNWAVLKDEGLIEERGEDLALTPEGVLLSNEVFLRMRP